MPALTFLIVDDNAPQRRVAGSILERAGHQAVYSARADDVAHAITAHDASVVLLSAALPHAETGRSLTAALGARRRAANGALPPPAVVIGAGPTERAYADELIRRGAAGQVMRPYEPERLVAQLELFSVGAAPATVLIVDDSPVSRRATAMILERAGHSVIEVADGVDAMACLTSAQHPIDLVLSDLVMPRSDGVDLCQQIRASAQLASLPVIVLTAQHDIASQSRAIEVGADDVLGKPIRATELGVRIRSLLRLKSLQARLARRTDDLERALVLRDDLTRLLAHDFRTPLTHAMVSAEMLVDECAAAGLAEATDLARGVVDASERLRGLTEDLLTIARLEQGAAPERSVFAIDAVLEEVAQRVRVAAASVDVAVQVRVDVEPGPASGPVKRTRSEGAGALEVVADPEWIRRVVQNLVDNAVKYAPRDSPIRIRARAHSNGGPGHDRDQVLITITDYGLQIPEEQRARIFHKFAQVPLRSRRGSGLGLAFCRLAVRAHGGDIWITDANDDGGDGAADDDAGTTFAFTLPRAAS